MTTPTPTPKTKNTVTTSGPFHPGEKEALDQIALGAAALGADLGFNTRVEFTRSPHVQPPAEQYTTCGHCGKDTGLPPAEPTQCPATGWDTHPDPTGGIISKHGIDQPLELAAERAASLKKDQLLAAADREIAELKQKHDDAQKQIAGLEHNNKRLRNDFTELAARHQGSAPCHEQTGCIPENVSCQDCIDLMLRGAAAKDELRRIRALAGKYSGLTGAQFREQESTTEEFVGSVLEDLQDKIENRKSRITEIKAALTDQIAFLKKELERANAARPADHSQVPAAGVDQILSLRDRIAGLNRELNSQDRKIADLEYGNQMLRGNIAELNDGIQKRITRILELEQELAGYKQRHDKLSKAFYDETDGPAVKDNHAEWIRQSKRPRITFNKMVLLATPVSEEEIANNPAKFPRMR